MSLKAFHLFFIIVATAFFGGFGAWTIYDFSVHHEYTTLILGVFSFIAGAAMIPYSFWFLKKFKDFGYL